MNAADWAAAEENANLHIGDLVTTRRRKDAGIWVVLDLIPHDYRPDGMSVRVRTESGRTFIRDVVEVRRVQPLEDGAA